jgi:ribosomal protein S18 acetylase RimI-like enzyme
MNIIEYNHELENKLEAFKALAWASADREHYGENQPDFKKEEMFLLAEAAGEIFGYIRCIYDMGVVMIESLIVHPEKKGQGIGSKLLLTAEEKVKDMGAHRIHLETGSDWRSRGFYEKHGYAVRETLPDYYDHKEFIIMEKKF